MALLSVGDSLDEAAAGMLLSTWEAALASFSYLSCDGGDSVEHHPLFHCDKESMDKDATT